MMALVGAETSFDKGREQLALLAGIEVTAKAVERHAEAIGADIAAREQQEIRGATHARRTARSPFGGMANPSTYTHLPVMAECSAFA